MKKHYRLTHEEWCDVSKRLKPAEIKVLYYLRTLDPFGDRWFDIQVTAIADHLNLNKGTVSRALRELADQGDIDLEIQTARVRLLSRALMLSTDNLLSTHNSLSTDNQDDRYTTSVIATQPQLSTDNNSASKRLQNKGSGASYTIQTFKTFSEGFRERREEHQEELPDECFTPTEEGILKITPAYEKWLRSKAKQLPEPPVLIEQWIESESLKSSNQRQFLHELGSLRRRAIVPPPVPDQFQIETAITQALLGGDRTYAQARLQQLWVEGWHDLVHEMCQLRQDWGFRVSCEGVQDVDAT